ncbi:uncharacterized protein [Periplaneta americana]|uniref:uncharacterized protein isoform X6 n=1 Tax=Periplaneta americana TaxID=6978 RepID=UPI0037E81A98
MDVIKMEPGSDPMGIQTSGIADVEEKKPLSEEGNLLDVDVTKIKTECIDHRYDIKSEIVFEESAVPIDFPMLKSEAEEEFCELDQVKEVKLEVTAEENEVLTERCYTDGDTIYVLATMVVRGADLGITKRNAGRCKSAHWKGTLSLHSASGVQ